MGLTNFPNGVSSFGIPVYGAQAGSAPLTATVLFVDTVNGVDAGPGTSPTAPFQTLTYALTQLPTTGLGAYSTIYVMQGSTVVVSSATALVIANANVDIVGMGTYNERPLFNFTTANTATIAVNAAAVRFVNCRFVANFLSIAACFTLTTAIHFSCENCLFTDASSVLNFLNIVKSTGAANTVDGLSMINNTWRGLGTTSVNSFILSANDIDRAVWNGNNIMLARTATAPALATITAGVLTNLQCFGNNTTTQQTATTTGALIGVSGTTGTGLIGYNFCATLQSTAASDLLVTAGHKFGFVQNFTAGAADKSGILVPAAFS
jgi:hypothetical protein